MAKTQTQPKTETTRTNTEDYLRMYAQMVRIRTFEDHANRLYLEAKMPGLTHMYSGEEAVAVGICEALTDDDRITSTHRGHGHCVAKGAAFKQMFCELLGRAEGYCRGKGGSMHIADQGHGNLGANAIVGGSMGIATGSALRAKMQGSDDVTVCFFGDGATAQGLWYEVMNMAALWKLPVIYACENNGYSEYTRTAEIAAGSITARAEALRDRGAPGRWPGCWLAVKRADRQKLWVGRRARPGRGSVSCRTDDLSLITCTMWATSTGPITAAKRPKGRVGSRTATRYPFRGSAGIRVDRVRGPRDRGV